MLDSFSYMIATSMSFLFVITGPSDHVLFVFDTIIVHASQANLLSSPTATSSIFAY